MRKKILAAALLAASPMLALASGNLISNGRFEADDGQASGSWFIYIQT